MKSDQLQNKFLDADCIFEKKKWISITGLCNNSCMFCLDGERPDKYHHDFKEVKKEIKQAREEGNTKLIISGGDPTIHPNVIDFVKYARKLGYEKIQIITNGRMFASKDFTDKIIGAGLDEVTFSIHSYTSEMHDSLTRVPGSFRQIIKGVRNVQSSKKNMIINTDTCITKKNYKELPKIIRFIVEKVGINEVNLMSMVPQGNAWDYKDQVMCDYEKAAPFVHQVIDYCVANNVVLWLSRWPAEYLEGYESFISDPYKMVDDVRGMKDFIFRKKTPPCKGEKCNYCGIKYICPQIVDINRKNSSGEKPSDKKAADLIITEQNYRNLVEEIHKISKRIKNPIISFVEPTISVNEYKKIAPRMCEVIPYLDLASKSHSFKMINIPICVFSQGKFARDEVHLLKDYYSKGQLDFIKVAENLSLTAKTKLSSCRKCIHYNKCDGIFIQYLRAYGSKEFIGGKVAKDLEYYHAICNQMKDYYVERLAGVYPKPVKKLTAHQILHYWQLLVADIINGKKENLLSIYVHIPFCRSKCNYCMYCSRQLNDQNEINQYIKYLIQNMSFFSGTFLKLKFMNLYIGGGTPSILNCEQIDKLLSNLFQYFEFVKEGERTFECNPDSISQEKLRLLKKFGFNRISFGVQSTDQDVLYAVNRGYQNYGNIESALILAKKYDFEKVNVDLIVGLKKQSAKSFLKSFADIAKLKPYSITVYPLSVGDLGKENLKLYMSEDKKKFYKSLKNLKKEIMLALRPLAKKYGYFCFQMKEYDNNWSFQLGPKQGKELILNHNQLAKSYECGHEMPFSLLGLGQYAVSHIYGYLHCLNETKGDNITLENSEYSSTELSIESEMFRYILKQIIRYSRISKTDFCKRFGVDVNEKFEYPIAALKYLNKIEINGDSICFIRTNLKERFIYLLFFSKIFKQYEKILSNLS